MLGMVSSLAILKMGILRSTQRTMAAIHGVVSLQIKFLRRCRMSMVFYILQIPTMKQFGWLLETSIVLVLIFWGNDCCNLTIKESIGTSEIQLCLSIAAPTILLDSVINPLAYIKKMQHYTALLMAAAHGTKSTIQAHGLAMALTMYPAKTVGGLAQAPS